MKIYYLLIPILYLFLACTKEVDVKIPPFKEKLVVEGRIEAGLPPIFILSKSQDIFSETNLQAYLASFVTDAEVYVSNGNIEVKLDLFCSNTLSPALLSMISDMIGVPVSTLQNINFCAYSTINPAIFGNALTTYTTRIEHNSKTYTGSSYLYAPKPLDTLFWKEISGKPGHGYAHATYADSPGEYDAFMWESKRLNTKYNEKVYKKPFAAVFEDTYTDGQTFSFYQLNPSLDGPKEFIGLYKRGDTVAIRLSRIDKPTYDFEATRLMQSFSNGNPFSSPMNVKTNLEGGGLGIFSAFASVYDTLICY